MPSDIYVVGVDPDGVVDGLFQAAVTFGHRAAGSPTLSATLYDDGRLVDGETGEAFAPALELDLLRALARYMADCGDPDCAHPGCASADAGGRRARYYVALDCGCGYHDAPELWEFSSFGSGVTGGSLPYDPHGSRLYDEVHSLWDLLYSLSMCEAEGETRPLRLYPA